MADPFAMPTGLPAAPDPVGLIKSLLGGLTADPVARLRAAAVPASHQATPAAPVAPAAPAPAAARPPAGPASAAPSQPQQPASAVVQASELTPILQPLGANADEIDGLTRTMHLEGRGFAEGTNESGHVGPFQFSPKTFYGLGGTDIHDPKQQAAIALKLWRQNKDGLTQALGRPPSPGELYLAHQQGLGGARALLTAPPDVNAISALTPVYGSEKIAREAVLQNGGSADMTAGEFARKWDSKFSGSWLHGAHGKEGGPADPYDGFPPVIREALKADDQARKDLQDRIEQYNRDAEQAAKDFSIHRPGEDPQPPPDIKPFQMQPQTDPTKVFGQFMPMLAMVAGFAVRGYGSAALRAGTAAMKAYKQNDLEALQRAHDQWKENTQLALDNWKLQNEYINDLWKADDRDKQNVLDRLKIKLQELGNYELAEKITQGKVMDLIHYQELGNTAAYRNAELLLREQHERAYEGHRQVLSSPAAKAASKVLADYESNPDKDDFTFIMNGATVRKTRDEIANALTQMPDDKALSTFLLSGQKYNDAAQAEMGGGGAEPAPESAAPVTGAAGSSQSNPVAPSSKAEAASLPSGTWIRDPSGNVFQKG